MKNVIIQRTLLVGLVALGILINWASTGFAQAKPVDQAAGPLVSLNSLGPVVTRDEIGQTFEPEAGTGVSLKDVLINPVASLFQPVLFEPEVPALSTQSSAVKVQRGWILDAVKFRQQLDGEQYARVAVATIEF